MLLLLPAWLAAVGCSFWALGTAIPWWAYPLMIAGWIGVLGAAVKAVERIWPEAPRQEAGEDEDTGELQDAA